MGDDDDDDDDDNDDDDDDGAGVALRQRLKPSHVTPRPSRWWL